MFSKKSAKKVKQKICIKKTNTFTIIAMNGQAKTFPFFQEQLKNGQVHVGGQ